jgi:hypothetical protein
MSIFERGEKSMLKEDSSLENGLAMKAHLWLLEIVLDEMIMLDSKP